MTNIKVVTSLTNENGTVKDIDQDTAEFTEAQTTLSGAFPGFVTVGTSEETLDLSELTTPKWLKIKNLDDTNFVDIGFSTGVYGIRIYPGKSNVISLKPSTTVYMLADTAAVPIYARGYSA